MCRYMRYLLLAVVLIAGCSKPENSTEHVIDFRYQPFHWETAIGLPFDWLKTTVNQEAALTYDYAPGPYATPLTSVHLGVANDSLKVGSIAWSRSHHGVVEATKVDASGIKQIDITLLRLTDPDAVGVEPDGFRRREVIYNHALGWVNLPDSIDEAFSSVSWSSNNKIVYEVKVDVGASKSIVLGWADSRYFQEKVRVIRAIVEGSEYLDVDPFAEAGNSGAIVRTVKGTDLDRDGWIRIVIQPSPHGIDPNSFISGIWVFADGTVVDDKDIINGNARSIAERVIDCGNDLHPLLPGVTDLMVGRYQDGLTPEVTIKTGRNLMWDSTLGGLLLGDKPHITSIPKAIGYQKVEGGYVLEYDTVSEVAITVHHGNNPATLSSIDAVKEALTSLDAAWEAHHAKHPLIYTVPDSTIQMVLQANWDNFYRIADRVEGRTYFQTGPSVYRHLWSGDATIFLQSGLFSGDTAGVRDYMDAVARYLEPTGQLKIMMPHILYRETPQYIMQLLYYAELSGDDAWLLNRWDQVQEGMEFIMDLSNQTLQYPDSSYYGQFPPGFADGGIAGVNAEYSTVYYTYVAMRHIERAVERLGLEEPKLTEWQSFEAGLLGHFRTAAKRDMRTDAYGNIFLPMKVGQNESNPSSTLAQWAGLEATNYGEWFKPSDSLGIGTLRTLVTHSEQGLAVGTGWIPKGVWPWFSSIQAVSHIQMDQPDESIELLFAITNHFSPLGTQVEEQLPRHVGERTGGDQSNASGSSYYLVHVRRMLVNERSDGLHLFPALPTEWLDEGETVRVNNTLTGFGPLTVQTQVSPDGSQLVIDWDLALRDPNWTPNLRIHTRAFEMAGFDVVIPENPGTTGQITAKRKALN